MKERGKRKEKTEREKLLSDYIEQNDGGKILQLFNAYLSSSIFPCVFFLIFLSMFLLDHEIHGKEITLFPFFSFYQLYGVFFTLIGLLLWWSDTQIRSQLDDAIASECPFCGDLMIREISLPFIQPEEAPNLTSWEIKPHNLGSQKSLSLAVWFLLEMFLCGILCEYYVLISCKRYVYIQVILL